MLLAEEVSHVSAVGVDLAGFDGDARRSRVRDGEWSWMKTFTLTVPSTPWHAGDDEIPPSIPGDGLNVHR